MCLSHLISGARVRNPGWRGSGTAGRRREHCRLPLRKRPPSAPPGCSYCFAANYQLAKSCPPRKSWASDDGSDEKQPGNPLLCRSFLAVRPETDISLAKYARIPSVTLLTKNPRNEFLSPFEVIITVAFCQYDNTIDWSYHHHPVRRLGADRVPSGDRLARLGANRQLLRGCID